VNCRRGEPSSLPKAKPRRNGCRNGRWERDGASGIEEPVVGRRASQIGAEGGQGLGTGARRGGDRRAGRGQVFAAELDQIPWRIRKKTASAVDRPASREGVEIDEPDLPARGRSGGSEHESARATRAAGRRAAGRRGRCSPGLKIRLRLALQVLGDVGRRRRLWRPGIQVQAAAFRGNGIDDLAGCGGRRSPSTHRQAQLKASSHRESGARGKAALPRPSRFRGRRCGVEPPVRLLHGDARGSSDVRATWAWRRHRSESTTDRVPD